MSLLFSITIPAFKSVFLYEAIESVILQSYQNWELIIVDDCSPNKILDEVKKFNDSRIHYYRNEKNFGAENVVDNWNKCLEYAKGDYMICMGDDDKLLPNCLEDYCKLIAKHPGLGVYHGWTEIIDDESTFYDVTAFRPEFESVYSLIWHRWKGRNQYVGDFLYDVELLRKSGGFYKLPLAWGSDDITAIKAAMEKGIANTETIVFQYRKNQFTISTGGKTVNDKLRVIALKKQYEWYSNFLMDEPKDPIDKKYWLSLSKMLSDKFRKSYIIYVAKDLYNNTFKSLLYWIRYRKNFDLSFKDIQISCLYALNAKTKGHF